jgi:hypothetical protein
MYGTPAASSACKTRWIVASALSPDTVKLPRKLLADLAVVEVRVLRPYSCDRKGSHRIAHVAGKQQLPNAGHPTMD